MFRGHGKLPRLSTLYPECNTGVSLPPPNATHSIQKPWTRKSQPKDYPANFGKEPLERVEDCGCHVWGGGRCDVISEEMKGNEKRDEEHMSAIVGSLMQ